MVDRRCEFKIRVFMPLVVAPIPGMPEWDLALYLSIKRLRIDWVT